MKHSRWLWGVVVFATFIFVVLVPAYTNAASTPVLFWPFNEGEGTTVADGTGNGYNGTLYNSPTWLDGGGIRLNGTNQYVGSNSAIANSLGRVNTAYTISTQVRIPSGVTNGNIIHIADSSTGIGWCIPMLSIANGKFRAQTWTNLTEAFATATTTVVSDRWYDIASTWSPDTDLLTLYVDGEVAASTSVDNFSAANANIYAFVGTSPGSCNGNVGYLNGDVRNVYIDGQALTQAEIQALYDPIIETLSPADNAREVSSDADLVITFNETVTADSGDITIYKVSDDSEYEVIDVTSGKVSGSGTDTITINPARDLGSAAYYVHVDSTAFEDGEGNHFAGINDKTTWNFYVGNLIAYWKFDEGSGTTANDSASSNHGTISGATYVATSSPEISFDDPYSLNFDGINDGVSTPLSLNNYATFTLAGWAYPRSNTTGAGWFGANDVFEFFFEANDQLRCWTPRGAVNWTYDPDTFLDKWHNITCIGDGDNVIMYVDGAQVGITPHTHTENYGTGDNFSIGLGVQAGGASGPFDGYIDDVRVYDRALTPAEMYSLGTGSEEPENNPVIADLSPEDGATGVSVDADLVATFSTTTIATSTGSIEIYTADDDVLVESISVSSGQITKSGADITINPTDAFADSTEYYVWIPGTAFADGSGLFYEGTTASTTWSFTTGDFTGPEISNIGSSVTSSTTVTITWETNELASTQVYYGTSTSYTATTTETDTSPRVTSHSQTLSDLSSCTTYHFAVASTDASDNSTTSSDTTFTTSGCVEEDDGSSGGGGGGRSSSNSDDEDEDDQEETEAETATMTLTSEVSLPPVTSESNTLFTYISREDEKPFVKEPEIIPLPADGVRPSGSGGASGRSDPPDSTLSVVDNVGLAVRDFTEASREAIGAMVQRIHAFVFAFNQSLASFRQGKLKLAVERFHRIVTSPEYDVQSDERIPTVLKEHTYSKVYVKVADASGNPISGAALTLMSEPRYATTGDDGEAVFEEVPIGEHTLKIAYGKYRGEQELFLSEDTPELLVVVTPNVSVGVNIWIYIVSLLVVFVLTMGGTYWILRMYIFGRKRHPYVS